VNWADRWLLPSLLGLTALVSIGTAGWGDLYNETDGQYGGAARVMAHGGSWLVPENDGIPRLVKPPLLYWAMAASMKIFGITEFAARLPGAISLAAWVAVTCLIGTQMGGIWRGFLAGAILLGSLGAFTLGRIIMPEPMFSALIAAALYCALRGHDDPTRRANWFLGFWLCAALASFSKGWHGLLYPLVIVGVAAIFCQSARRNLRGLLSWQGLLIFSVINLPWYFYIEHKFPGWFHNMLFTEQIGHVIGSSAPATDYTSVPRGQFLLLHLAWFFPWSLVVLANLWKDAVPGIRRFTKNKDLARPPSFATVLIISWATVIPASVLLAGQRQDYYAMSMWPAFALGTAALIEGRSLRPAAILLVILLTAGFCAAMAIPLFTNTTETATVAERATAWTTVTKFDGAVWSSLRFTALLSLGGAALGCLFAAILHGRRSFLALLAATFCLAIGAVSGTAIVSPFFSLAQAAPAITRAATPDTQLVYDGGLDTGSSLLFYTSLPVALLNQNPDKEFPVRRFGIGRDLFLDTGKLAILWQSGKSILLVTESAKLPEWERLLGKPLTPIGRCGTQIVLKN
jgi:4-amino-4-deoxy-L-arabinose transferase-like glycosyltransferase